jgi:hypothetical protein
MGFRLRPNKSRLEGEIIWLSPVLFKTGDRRGRTRRGRLAAAMQA